MPNHQQKPDHGPGVNTGLTVHQEQQACHMIIRRFETLAEQNEMHEALNVWPDSGYQAYLNGS